MHLRLKSETKHFYQLYFIKYINELAPEVRDSLKQLTKDCIQLFGKYSFNQSGFDQWQVDFRIAVFVNRWLWRESHEYTTILRPYQVERLKNPKPDPSFIIPDGSPLITKELQDFQNKFYAILEKFHLEKKWLANLAFKAIWNGTGQLKYYDDFAEFPSDEIIKDIKKAFNRDTSQHPGVQEPKEIPLPDLFRYQEHFSLPTSPKKYIKEAVEAYEQHLHRYFAVIEEVLKKHDYKSTKGDKHDYTRVKWLVWRIFRKWDNERILEEIEKETRNGKKYGKFLDISTVEKAFTAFKNFDLPVPPKPRGTD